MGSLWLCWTLWGTVVGDPGSETSLRWKRLAQLGSRAACSQAAWAEQQERPMLEQVQVEEGTMRELSIVRWPRHFACRPCAEETPPDE